MDADAKTIPWMTYDGVVGGKALPAGAVPPGWSAGAFAGLRHAGAPMRASKGRIRIVRVKRSGARVRVTLRAVGGTLAKVRVIVVRRAGGKVLARRTVNRLTARRRTVVLRVQGAGRHIRVKATSA